MGDGSDECESGLLEREEGKGDGTEGMREREEGSDGKVRGKGTEGR